MLIIIFEKMSNAEKRIHFIQLLGKKADWENWTEKLPLHGKHKVYEKQLASNWLTKQVDKIPT